MKKMKIATLITIALILGACIILLLLLKGDSAQTIWPLKPTLLPGYKMVTRDRYTFQIPDDWILVDPKDFDGCRWDGVVNNGADGHRQNGEIGIYQKSCFDITKSLGKKEVAEKDGYYIIAYYDKETGTTKDEELETRNVHQNLVNTFSAK